MKMARKGQDEKEEAMEKRLMTVEEAATALNLPRSQVYRLLQRGELPGVRLGRYWRIPGNVVELLLKQGREGGEGHGRT